MPSPLAHVATGYALYHAIRDQNVAEPQLLGATIAFSLLPDADSLVGLVGRDFIRYHNNISHSLGFAAGAGILAGMLFGWGQERFWRWFSVGFLATSLHLSLDYWATRRGLMLLWPFSSRRFISPARLFYGFRWGRGVWSITHLYTALTEILYGLVLVIGLKWIVRRLRA